VAISADSRWVLTGSEDKTARLWDLQMNDLIDLAGTVIGRNLFPDEWQLYFPGEAYRKTFPDLYRGPTIIETPKTTQKKFYKGHNFCCSQPIPYGRRPLFDAGRMDALTIHDRHFGGVVTRSSASAWVRRPCCGSWTAGYRCLYGCWLHLRKPSVDKQLRSGDVAAVVGC
jgi:hypothetical protein